MSRRAIAITAALLFLALLAGAAAVSVVANWALSPALASAPSAIFDVQPGTSLGQVALDLEARGLIRSALAFKWLARYRQLDGALQVGEYEISAALAPGEILTPHGYVIVSGVAVCSAIAESSPRQGPTRSRPARSARRFRPAPLQGPR